MELLNNNEKLIQKKIELETYILIGQINDLSLIDNLILEVRKGVEKSTVSRKTNVKGKHTEFKYLVSNKDFHNFLKIIQPSIFKIYKRNFIIKEVWGNIYSNKDYAVSHTHDDSAFCGILYCTDGPGPGTYFKQYDLNIEEKKGRFVLFHPVLEHEVKPYDYKNERITIAWNFSEVKDWVNYQNTYFIKTKEEIIL